MFTKSEKSKIIVSFDFIYNLLELSHEVLVELDQPVRPLGAWRKERGSEMQRSFFLAKAGTGDDAHARGIEHTEAVELIGLAAFLLGLLDGFLGEFDGGEEVHRTLFKCQ